MNIMPTPKSRAGCAPSSAKALLSARVELRCRARAKRMTPCGICSCRLWVLENSRACIVILMLAVEGEDTRVEILKNSNRHERGNSLAELCGLDVLEHKTLEANFLQWDRKVKCTIGSSLRGWPRRDQNEYVRRVKCQPDNHQGSYSVLELPWTLVPGSCVITTKKDIEEGEAFEMRDKERCLWLLMQYARPSSTTYLCEWEDGTTVVREPERMESGFQAKR